MIFVPNLEYCNNRMKGDVMQISKEELQSSSIPLAKALEEYLQHHLDIITDSDWFAELVEEKVAIAVKKSLTEEDVLEKIWDNKYKTLKERKKNG